MLLLIIVLFLVFGFGGGYVGHGYYGNPYMGGGIGIGTVLLILLVLWMLGVFGPRG